MIAGKALNIKQVFDKILARNSDVNELILLSYSGLPMVSTMQAGSFESEISAMTAGIMDLSQRSIRAMKWNDLQSVILTSSKGYIVARDIREVGLLVAVTRTGVEWPRLQAHIDWLVTVITSFNK